jgi:hypothetical protein
MGSCWWFIRDKIISCNAWLLHFFEVLTGCGTRLLPGERKVCRKDFMLGSDRQADVLGKHLHCLILIVPVLCCQCFQSSLPL